MHIPENYLSPSTCAVFGVAMIPLWTRSLAKVREELSPDLMRHRSDAPREIMEYLFVRLLVWGKEEGYGAFSLGMAPLSGLQDRSLVA